MKKDTKNKKKIEFEFCKVCKRNHDEGLRHKYFPYHKKGLSTFLSRFQSKLTDIRFFLKNPTANRPQNASLTSLWCVFCDADIREFPGSSFACENVIKHLASPDHLKELKHFLWKYGSGTDSVDSFSVSEADLVKWEKKCKVLEKGAVSSSGDGSHGVRVGNLNDIRDTFDRENINNFENNDKRFDNVKLDLSNGVVMPLQYFTNENQISCPGSLAVTNGGPFVHGGISSLPMEVFTCTSSGSPSDSTVYWNSQHSISNNSQVCFSNLSNGRVYQGKSAVECTSSSQGLQTMIQISTNAPEKVGGNVHTGAPPPWFDVTKENQLNVQPTPVSSSIASVSNKPGKAHKLNPKRVGAAWAEKRKIELELENKGEIVKSNSDASWLPNFGRVWHYGSRKESRKEFDEEKPKLRNKFEKEKQKLLNVENHSETPVAIQPYISKRMRQVASE